MKNPSTPKDAPPTTANPYLNARREWDERYGDHIARARNWRLAAFCAMGIAALSVAGVSYIGSQSKIQPMVVAIDGMGSPLAMARPSTEAASSRIITAQLANWIWNARTVLSDTEGQKELIERVYAMASSDAAKFLNGEYAQNPPFGDRTVSVKITSVLPLSKDTWQVSWTELPMRSGQPQPSQQWRANITTGVDQEITSKPAVLLANPLGIYVKSVTWTSVIADK